MNWEAMMEKDQDHSGIESGGIEKGSRNSADADARVAIAAEWLAIRFTDDTDLPARYRKALPLLNPRNSRKIPKWNCASKQTWGSGHS